MGMAFQQTKLPSQHASQHINHTYCQPSKLTTLFGKPCTVDSLPAAFSPYDSCSMAWVKKSMRMNRAWIRKKGA